jgi:methionyl aminopeptidase
MIYVKTDKEIDLMREPCKILRDALLLAEDKIKAGMTTGELDKILHDYIISSGAKPSFYGLYGFPKATCISIDDEVVHGIPGDRVIKEGQIVSVDVGAFKNGFHGDGARSLYVGNIDPMKKKLIDVTKECFFKALEEIGDGVPLGTIGNVIQKHAESNGFSVVRALVGHGIGTEMHEDPSVPNFGTPHRGARLIPGMTLAIEPMINMGSHEVEVLDDDWTVVTVDGSLSAHFEHTIAITGDGPIIMTLPD